MKTTITNQYAFTVLSLFMIFTIFSLATQVRSSYAETDNNELVCQESQRGIRCGKSLFDDNASFTTSQIDQLLALEEEFCSSTSRGIRCLNISNDIATIKNDERTFFEQEKSRCTISVRGSRCRETHS